MHPFRVEDVMSKSVAGTAAEAIVNMRSGRQREWESTTSGGRRVHGSQTPRENGTEAIRPRVSYHYHGPSQVRYLHVRAEVPLNLYINLERFG